MKTLKIAQDVHRELKIFVANCSNGETISDFAGLAIMEKLKNSGHQFSKAKQKKQKSLGHISS